MSKLSVFLNPISTDETKEIVISKRFVDENGEPAPFVIRALRQEEVDEITKKCTKRVKMDGRVVEQLDSVAFTRAYIVAGTVEPDFSNSDLCKHYGVLDPNLLPSKMLLNGEFTKLSNAIMELSGGGITPEEEVKN